MDKEQIKKIIDSPPEYDESKEESFTAWVRESRRRSQRWVIIHCITWCSFFLALAILCGILFLKTDHTKFQIMYAAFFVCCILIAHLMQVFGWVMINKNRVTREVNRLELRIAELCEILKDK